MRLIIILLSLGQLVTAQVVGSNAKNFTLQQLDGGTITFDDHAGKVIYINWFGYACPTCLAEGNETQTKIADQYKGQNFVAWGIDVWDGTSSGVQNYKNRTGITYPLLLDGGSTASDWGVSYQYSTVVDQQGVIQFYDRTNKVDAINAKITELLSATRIAPPTEPAPFGFELRANYPNPFNPRTAIPFTVDREQNIRLDIYNVNGKRVQTLVNNRFAAGQYELSWNGRDINGQAAGSGVYFVRLQGERVTHTRRILLLK
ncbi:MAG: T9SS C-terminal target domain-containing protein [Calditrichaeota bacterium]|nr:MAG: T9SS C-terminal target domain-containing protein [Calditrichota bacterium]